ncbi:DUF3099 domain-containing protein [Streptomyces reniochalinae]|uniref:DUF3099 domain-containing protein n=1 Tax=Streptomyces reniochalinae TaxID=2250578 RepID=A0A367EH78_9ACTN|nr:DUF3099 domain-containing protein [Streptomyces reniochalinae]RCG16707.1 DUF3099 domain-containing protein [Streptomyces reniochalinae]
MMRKQHQAEVFRITGARTGLQEDVRGRQRRYVISMLLRTVAVLAAVLLWDVERPLAIVALVLGGVLPYVAVVIANAGRENAPSAPSTFVPEPQHHVLEGSHVTKAEGNAPSDEAGQAANESADKRS